MPSSREEEGLLQDPRGAGSGTGASGEPVTGGTSGAGAASAGDYIVTKRSETTATPAVSQAETVTPTSAQPAVPAVPDESTTLRSAGATDDEALRVRRYEEELRASTVERQAGAVRIEKDVVEEQRTLEVPVSREEVHVRSVTPSTTAGDVADAFQEGVIEVPLTEEEVVARKQVRVAEELEIEKRAVTETQRVSDTVRREVVDIQEVGELDVDRRSENPLDETVRPQ